MPSARVVTIAAALLTSAADLPNPDAGSIAGAVQSYHAPAKPSPVTVVLSAPGLPPRSVRSGARGAYVFDQLLPGSYNLLFIAADDFKWGIDGVAVCARDVTVRDTEDPRRHPMVMPPIQPRALAGSDAAELLIHAGNPNGQPVAGIAVTVTRIDDHSRPAGARDADGVMHFANLRAGSYLVSVAVPGSATTADQPVTLKPGESTEVEQPVCPTQTLRAGR